MIDLCSATSIESSLRDRLNGMAVPSSISKNNQNMHYSFTFQDRPIFSHINGKLSPNDMNDITRMTLLNIDLSLKITKIPTSHLFFRIDQCSATSTESSRRDHLSFVIEQQSISKNNPNLF